MNGLETINKDLESLFEQGKKRLYEGNGNVINDLREVAFEKFRSAGGIPQGKEDYMYIDLIPVFSADYHIPLQYIRQEIDIRKEFKCKVAELDPRLLLTINGWYYPENVVKDLPEGVIVCSMKEAEVKYPGLFHKYYNRNAEISRQDGLIHLNTAFAQDGTFVYIPDGIAVESPLQIVNILRAEKDLMAFQRNMVILGKNAVATLLICDHTLSENRFLMNNVTEVYLEEGAALDYNQIQNQHIHTNQFNSIFVSEERNASFDGSMISLYGGVIRNNIYAALKGEGGNCTLTGIYILDKKQCVDNFTYIDHQAAHCTSYEHFKGVLDDSALANFTGCVVVRPDAQKTDSFQANNNLLLTNTARINAKPQLIIDADDVKCSHGATVGQLDEEAMFYLRSRGISEKEARLMLMFGFAHDIVQRIKMDALREEIDKMIDMRFRGELSKCHNCILHCLKSE